MAKSDASSCTEQTFENALARLEEIVEQMDSPSVPLDRLIADYEEGVKLVKICQAKLNEAGQKIETITRSAGHDPQLAPFEAEAAGTDPTPVSGPRKNVRLF